MGDEQRVWDCKIGYGVDLPKGSDLPMRNAVAAAFKEITGEHPDFIFSGWAASLTEGELAVHEDRMPDPERIIAEARAAIDEAMERIDGAVRWAAGEYAAPVVAGQGDNQQ